MIQRKTTNPTADDLAPLAALAEQTFSPEGPFVLTAPRTTAGRVDLARALAHQGGRHRDWSRDYDWLEAESAQVGDAPPGALGDLYRRLSEARRRYRAIWEHDPNWTELADEAGYHPRTVRKWRHALAAAGYPFSLHDAPL